MRVSNFKKTIIYMIIYFLSN